MSNNKKINHTCFTKPKVFLGLLSHAKSWVYYSLSSIMCALCTALHYMPETPLARILDYYML